MALETLFFQNNTGTVTQFLGERVAYVSSELPSKERHTEFSYFISEHGEHILQGVGRTKVEGERDRYWCIVSEDPGDLLQGILGTDVSRLAKRLLVEVITYLADCVCDE